jgi:[ribosomal protein S5]-alanine N-acetyltransferase
MQLETPRLLLRDFVMGDWADLHAYSSDPLVVRYMSFEPNTATQAQEHLKWCIAMAQEQPRRIYELAVVLKDELRVIGTCTLALHPHERRKAAFSYLFNRQYWGQGYATEAMRVLITFGFSTLDLHRVEDTCDARNYASARVMEKLGMQREGCLREAIWDDGRWYGEYIYAVLDHEWQQ